MTLCSDGHNEVCYECRNCPACEEKAAKEAAEEKVTELERRVDELESRE